MEPHQNFVRTRVLIIVILVLLIAQIVMVVVFNFYFNQSGRITYVRSEYVLSKYAGTVEARNKLNAQRTMLQSNLDTLRSSFQRSLAMYQAQLNSLSKNSKLEWEGRLGRQEEQLNQYEEAIQGQVQAEDEKLVKSILNQINSFAASYGEQKGFLIILGTSEGGGVGVLYGMKTLDITEDFLTELNKSYKGE